MAERKAARRSARAANSAAATRARAHEPFGDGPPADEVLRHMPRGSALPLGTDDLDVGDLVSAEFCIDGVPSRAYQGVVVAIAPSRGRPPQKSWCIAFKDESM